MALLLGLFVGFFVDLDRAIVANAESHIVDALFANPASRPHQ
jgi:hypothetical protein